MMMEKVETQKDIDRLMQELNYFHDYVVLHIEYTSGTAILSDGIDVYKRQQCGDALILFLHLLEK